MPPSRTALPAILCLFLLISVGLYAQTAEQIVAKHIDALGGKEKLQSIHSLYIQSVSVLPNGTQMGTKSWKVYDRLYRQEVSLGANNIIVIVTPRSGWASNPISKGKFKSLPSDQLRGLQPEIDPAGPLVDYADKGCKIELAGKDTVGKNDCYKIRLSCPAGQSVTYFIDTKTWYILRETRKGSNLLTAGGLDGNSSGGAPNAMPGERVEHLSSGEVSIDFSDYKKGADGYIFPYTLSISGVGAKGTVEKIEVNKTVDYQTLSRPK